MRVSVQRRTRGRRVGGRLAAEARAGGRPPPAGQHRRLRSPATARAGRQAAAAVARGAAGGRRGCGARTRPSGTATTRTASSPSPTPRIESFYWIQMYKLASATRADRPAIDTMGPWYDRTPWPGVWWNLNIQLSYWPVYAANRLAAGRIAAGHRRAQPGQPARQRARRRCAPTRWRWGAWADPTPSSPVTYTGPRGPKNGAHELSNLVWVMHNYWLHWRHTLDDGLRERLYPLLEGRVAYVLHRLAPGPDGQLHLPEAVSPEFPKTAPDTNYDLAAAALGAADPARAARPARRGARIRWCPRWRDTLARLTPYPVGDSRLPDRAGPAARSVAPALLPSDDGLPAAPGDRRSRRASGR